MYEFQDAQIGHRIESTGGSLGTDPGDPSSSRPKHASLDAPYYPRLSLSASKPVLRDGGILFSGVQIDLTIRSANARIPVLPTWAERVYTLVVAGAKGVY